MLPSVASDRSNPLTSDPTIDPLEAPRREWFHEVLGLMMGEIGSEEAARILEQTKEEVVRKVHQREETPLGTVWLLRAWMRYWIKTHDVYNPTRQSLIRLMAKEGIFLDVENDVKPLEELRAKVLEQEAELKDLRARMKLVLQAGKGLHL